MDHKDRAMDGNKDEDTDEDMEEITDEDMEEDMVEAEDVDDPTNLAEGEAEAKDETNQGNVHQGGVIASPMVIVPTPVHNAPHQAPTIM